ncbi:MFS transporter [Companilactobacillus baiquanensis]|uniref:MFS transporter n=1 Tax=Companilactobacillus baiquanensis TaxID=2486005 RepID=A0ABW1UW62_9LACO|nr:MFS transporter [Companilactobacillus baiquanensis]
MDAPKTHRRVRWWNYAAYGMTDWLGAGSTALTGAWLLFFYTTFCGLTATEGSLIFAISRFVDAITSPLMGMISDNFYKTKIGKRFGRRKFFIMIGIPFMLAYILMWISGMNFWYYLVTYVGFDIIYTMVLVPYETLATEMTNDFKQRTIFSGARLFCGQISAFFSAFVPGRLIAVLGKDNPKSFLYAAMMFTAAFIIILIFLYFFTWERPLSEIVNDEVDNPDEDKLSLGQKFEQIYIDLLSTFKIKAFRTHILMYLGCYISQDIFSQVYTYFVVFALGFTTVVASNVLSVIWGACIVGVVLGIVAVTRANRQAGTYRIAVLGFAVGTIGFVVAYFSNSKIVMTILIISAIVSGLGRGALAYIPWNIYSFIPDVDEIVTGQRREGIFAGVMTFTRKATQALAVFLVGVFLDGSGFKPSSQTQSIGVVHTLVIMLAVGTLAFLLMGYIASFKFKLTKDKHEILLSEVEELREGKKPEDISEENAALIKDLSGFDKHSLWGNNKVGHVDLMRWKKEHGE